VQRRNYAGPGDLVAMQRAVQRAWVPGRRWHVGDLAWRRHAVPGLEPDWRTALWLDRRGAVVAWGWTTLPGRLDLHVDSDHPGLAGDVLAWFDDVATGCERTVTVMDTEGELIAALEAAHYRPAPPRTPFFRHCVLDLDDSLAVPRLPAGYRVRAVREGEAAVRAAAHRTAWRPGRIGALLVPPVDLGDAPSRVTTESYRAVMRAWPYRHDLDQVVEAPDGTLVAFALGWLDGINRAGELEPVGTDPGHARRGLATAVSLACLRALRDAGATRAVVYPRGDAAYPVAGRLYLRLGFRPVARTVTYIRRAVGAGGG
jgi:ribosomal protein S18 acetylase RimI-like enzyme